MGSTPATDTDPGTDPGGTDTPATDTQATDTPGTDTPGTDTPTTDSLPEEMDVPTSTIAFEGPFPFDPDKPPQPFDGLMVATIQDLEIYWAETMPQVFGIEYTPLEGGVFPAYPQRTDYPPGASTATRRSRTTASTAAARSTTSPGTTSATRPAAGPITGRAPSPA